jgi:hypothetical protein
LGKTPKKGSQKQLEHPLTLEVCLHGEHLVYYILHEKKNKPKTLMSFNKQQKLTKGEKLRGRPKGNQVEH